MINLPLTVKCTLIRVLLTYVKIQLITLLYIPSYVKEENYQVKMVPGNFQHCFYLHLHFNLSQFQLSGSSSSILSK